jgi:hypothetical protein
MSFLEYEFTPKVLESYAHACNKIVDILVKKYEEGYSELIMPSRGAKPIVEGTILALKYRRFHEDSCENFLMLLMFLNF